jgi:hypothetical protein
MFSRKRRGKCLCGQALYTQLPVLFDIVLILLLGTLTILLASLLNCYTRSASLHLVVSSAHSWCDKLDI